MASPPRNSTGPVRRQGPRAEQADATREHLIGTAITLLGSGSYQGATVFEVAKAAGLTHGAVQHHFGSKAVLMVEVIDAILRDSGPDGVAWPAAELPLAARCDGLVHALWQRAYAAPRFLAAWAVYFGSAAEPELRLQVAQKRQAVTQTLIDRFLAVLPELQTCAEAPALVQLVLSGLRGLGMVRLFGDPGPAEAAQLQLLGRLLLVHCQGAAPPATPSPVARPHRKP